MIDARFCRIMLRLCQSCPVDFKPGHIINPGLVCYFILEAELDLELAQPYNMRNDGCNTRSFVYDMRNFSLDMVLSPYYMSMKPMGTPPPTHEKKFNV